MTLNWHYKIENVFLHSLSCPVLTFQGLTNLVNNAPLHALNISLGDTFLRTCS